MLSPVMETRSHLIPTTVIVIGNNGGKVSMKDLRPRGLVILYYPNWLC